ncbi:MAG TPA: hypothetical protein VMM18_07460 [Gemmatimonadaceae bacterium]|nr:hypothetical protein [Gemmatimonadaceae bacterium]
MNEPRPTGAGLAARVASEEARELLRRAAELQAEAMTRLEERVANEARRAATDAEPADGFAIADIEAAAQEAGISPDFVRQAMAEQTAIAAMGGPLPAWLDRAGNRLLRPTRRWLEIARTIEAPPGDVLATMRLMLPQHPYRLSLVETGGDPLDGGYMIFTVPSQFTTNSVFALDMAYGSLKRLHVSMRPVRNGAATDVRIGADLRHGIGVNWWLGTVFRGMSGAAGVWGGGAAGAVAANALGTVSPALAVGIGAVAAASALVPLTGAGVRKTYHWGIRRSERSLRDLLGALDAAVRSGGFPPPSMPQRPGAS